MLVGVEPILVSTVFTHPRYQYVENSKNYINYLWTELEGYSKFVI